MRSFTIALIAAALLASAPNASAVVPFTANEQSYVTFASHFWNASACNGHPHFFVATDAEIDAAFGADGALGLSWVEECRTWISDWPVRAGDAWTCSLVVHEYGHLLGHDHDEGGVMDAEGGNTVIRPCAYGFGYRPCARLSRSARFHGRHRHRRLARRARTRLHSCRRLERRYRAWR